MRDGLWVGGRRIQSFLFRRGKTGCLYFPNGIHRKHTTHRESHPDQDVHIHDGCETRFTHGLQYPIPESLTSTYVSSIASPVLSSRMANFPFAHGKRHSSPLFSSAQSKTAQALISSAQRKSRASALFKRAKKKPLKRSFQARKEKAAQALFSSAQKKALKLAIVSDATMQRRYHVPIRSRANAEPASRYTSRAGSVTR
jgi:hypothetical protein